MKDKYTHIFEPLTVRTMTIKNRICMMPMGTNYGEQNGEMSFLHIDYYRQRAKGGTGLLIVENANVDFPQGSNGTTQLRIDHDNYLPRLYKFCEDMHRYGTKVSIQINHAGASAMSSRIGGLQPVSASNIPSKTGGATPRPLTKDEILAIVKKYGEAAKRAQTAGFDAVEIHAGHSYLISQFLSPVYNDRTDEFGGSIENRTRFCRMIIDEVRSQIGPHMPIMLRLSADEFVKGGNTLEDTLKYLEKGGRLSKAAAFVGTMLDIKPILTIEHGLVESLDKLRGKKKLLDKLIAKIQDDSDFDAENPKFLIVQSDEDKGQEVCEKLRDEYGEDCIEMYGEFGPLIGTHVGRGAIAILVKIVTE